VLGIHGSTAIWGHELIGRYSLHKVSPAAGVAIGSIEMVIGLYMLVAWAWGGYRDMRAERKESDRSRQDAG
jgi:hypothetical protein